MFFDDLEKKGSAGSGAKHPTTGWYDWKSASFGLVKNAKGETNKEKIEDGYFKVWDKEAQVEKKFPLKEMPKEFVVVSESWNVKGYLQSKGGVWGPEIYDFNEPLTVLHDKEVLYKGLWRDIKADVNAVGLKLHRNLHCFDVKNPKEMFTICLKGQASVEWGQTFQEENSLAFLRKRISFGPEKEMNTGQTDYTVPTFKIGKDLTEEEKEQRYEHLQALRAYHTAAAEPVTEETTDEVNKYDDDNLPF